MPFECFSWKSLEEYNGWVIPQNWTVEKAQIWKNGEMLFDGKSHVLGVASYSCSFSGQLNKKELDRHLFSNPRLPNSYMWHCSWLYRPWERNWGFCIPYALHEALPDGMYDVVLETEFRDGYM